MLLVILYVALLVLVMWREPQMIYYPAREIELTPDKAGLQYEDVWLTTADGVRINGWFVPAVAARPSTDSGRQLRSDEPDATAYPALHRSAATTTNQFTILFLHGNAGNISHRQEKLAILHELGAAVFILDYRGYGRSDGTPNEQGTYADARAAYEYLTKQRGLDPKHIILYGESLGSAVAVQLATEMPVGGVILEEAFTSVGDVGQKMFPFLPVRWVVRNKYDSLSKIARINAPLLLLHSRNDEIFPYHHAERLLAASREPKRLVEMRGNHNDAFAVSAETYQQALRDFIASVR